MKSLPTNSRNLSVFAMDMEHHLDQTGLFSRIRMIKTGQSSCALVVICTVANPATTQVEVAQALERVWNEAPLGYGEGKDLYRITTATFEVQMGFSTVAADVSVTGRIEVMGFS